MNGNRRIGKMSLKGKIQYKTDYNKRIKCTEKYKKQWNLHCFWFAGSVIHRNAFLL